MRPARDAAATFSNRCAPPLSWLTSAFARKVSQQGHGHMATTLTLGIGVWPWIYIVQVGDSRAYIYTHGSLRQITRDQTLAEDFVDRG
jgi:serine/threonine protein phosphatase PrpC